MLTFRGERVDLSHRCLCRCIRHCFRHGSSYRRRLHRRCFMEVGGRNVYSNPVADALFCRWCFYVNLPIGAIVVACLICTLKLPKQEREPASLWRQVLRLDPLGTFFFVPSIVCLSLALQLGGSSFAWNSPRIIALLFVFALLLVAFCCVQYLRPETATVPVRIITQRTILAAAVFIFALAASMLIMIYYLPIWCKSS